MGKGKRGRDEVDTYAEDDFVENDDGNAPKKKTKKATPSKGGKKSIDEKSWEVSFPSSKHTHLALTSSIAILWKTAQTIWCERIQGSDAHSNW